MEDNINENKIPEIDYKAEYENLQMQFNQLTNLLAQYQQALLNLATKL